MSGDVIYAIGDVHGEAERYGRLLGYIDERHARLYPGRDRKIVQLGDLVDRGPDSFQTMHIAMELEQARPDEVVHLRGNHEQMMLEALLSDTGSAWDTWLANGGDATLESYRRAGFETIPEDHVDWLRKRRTLHSERGAQLIFVHAGIDVDAFPHCREMVRLWTRSPDFFASDTWSNRLLEGWRVVHGHTPTDDFMPEIDGAGGRRINIDTGAVFGGRLTAAVFAPGEEVGFVYA